MYKGIILMFVSALFFSLATVFAKIVTAGSDIIAVQITFFRFLFGFAFAVYYMLKTKQSYKANNFKLIIFRVFSNTIAVILFFTAVEYTTITNANMINMTYPVFVFIVAPLINNESVKPIYYFYLLLTMLGVYFVAVPELQFIEIANFIKIPYFKIVGIGDLIALASAIVAGVSISILREARKFDSTTLILFYLMGIGTIFNFFIMLPYWITPNFNLMFFIVLSALSGVIGQVAITHGYKYISASSGAIISTSRIIIAAILGFLVFSDQITFKTIVGGLLIFISLAGVIEVWKVFNKKVSFK